MPTYDDLLSSLAVLGYQEGYTDLLAIVRDAPRETNINATASNIRPQDVLAVKTFDLQLKQKSENPDRYAGEGVDPNTFAIGNSVIHTEIKMPLIVQITGWPDPSIANLWDLASLAHFGTASAAIGGLVTNFPSGSTYLTVNNIADFVALPTPYVATLSGAGETTETITIVGVVKAQRKLMLLTPTVYDHAGIVSALPANDPAVTRDPDFSLFSLREGMLSPCLVNKLTLTATIGEPVSISVEVASLGIYRDRQIEFASLRDSIVASVSQLLPIRLVESMAVTLSAASSSSGLFGLFTAIGDPLFEGYQGLNLPSLAVSSISISIDNRLQEQYTFHSLNTEDTHRKENMYPFALASEGRHVTGEIKFDAPIDPWLVAERLAGPSGLNGGGIIINFGVFSITLPDIAWAPSTSTGESGDQQTRTLSWALLAQTKDALPELLYAPQA